MLGNQLEICMFFLFKKSEIFSCRPPARPIFDGKPYANQTINWLRPSYSTSSADTTESTSDLKTLSEFLQ